MNLNVPTRYRRVLQARMADEIEECEDNKWNEFQIALVHDSGEAAIKGDVQNKEYEVVDDTLSDVKKYECDDWPKNSVLIKL
ncbi:hypothetical protein NDU88_002984 [Pleurodeles waltl]|uniref:Uncharacterized protein n=1 Tax=Pleurodeles waltl TaxID=8319 RepID=A0AAV7T573_PLEWA|nr:hypothetical protein NDU88_002984 [Pleurodeles waltl]